MEMKSRANKQGGFTFIEILVASVIIALVASILGPLLTETKDKNVTVGQEIALMRATIQNLDDRYSDESITSDVDNTEIIDGRILPKAYRRNDSDEIYSLFGGKITVDGVDENGLTWETEGVPTDVCAKFVDDAKSLGFELVDIDGTQLRYSEALNADFTSACDASNDTVTVTWTREEG